MENFTGLNPDSKGQELKRKLLECIEKESSSFSEVTHTYFSKEKLTDNDRASLLSAIINAVDHILAAGDWNNSLFLRNTLKPLQKIKAEAEAELEHFHIQAKQKAVQVKKATDNETEVYISLFQSDGYNIAKWALQLRSLHRYIIGRPIYPDEASAEKRLRGRGNAVNEAYVIVVVKKTDIQPSPLAGTLKDQFDQPLLQLKEHAIAQGRIIGFVHQGVRYYFVDGQLVKQ